MAWLVLAVGCSHRVVLELNGEESAVIAEQQRCHAGGQSQWVLTCPFCGPLGRTDGKKKHRKAALLWNRDQNSWVFHCVKGGHAQCRSGKSLGTLISALNPELGEKYRMDRWHSGTTGRGHNCRMPKVIRAVGAGRSCCD